MFNKPQLHQYPISIQLGKKVEITAKTLKLWQWRI